MKMKQGKDKFDNLVSKCISRETIRKHLVRRFSKRASGIGQGSMGLKQAIGSGNQTGDLLKRLFCEVRGSNPGPTKRLYYEVRGIKTWTYKTLCICDISCLVKKLR